MKFYHFILLVSTSLFISSCAKTFYGDLDGADVGTNQGLAFPLVNSHFTSSELLTGLNKFTTVEPLPSGQLIIFYREENVYKQTLGDIINVPLPGFNITDTLTDLALAGVFIEKLDIKSGNIHYNFTSPVNEDIKVEMELVGGIYTGTNAPMKYTFNFPYTGSNNFQGDIDVSQSHIAPPTGLKFRYDARKISDNSRITLSPFQLNFVNVEYQFIQGTLIGFSYPIPLDTIQFDAFSPLYDGELYLEDPSIDLTITNTLGLPVDILIDTLMVKGKDNVVRLGQGTYVSTPVTLNYPDINHIGQPAVTHITFDNNNCNMSDLARPLIKEVYYAGKITSPNFQPGYATDTSYLQMDLIMRLPFRGWTKNLLVGDTFNVNLAPFKDYSYIEFQSVTENRVPADVHAQMYFADENQTIIDSMFIGDDQIFVSPPVDAQGKTIGGVRKQINSRFEGTRMIDLVDRTRYIIVFGRATSLNNGNTTIELYEDNSFDYKLGVKVGF